MNLSDKKCVACEGGTAPFGEAEIASYLSQLKPGWQVINGKKVKKEFKFKNFVESIEFVNKIAAIAEAEGHHPDIYIIYNVVGIELWTHAINGLSENDFIMAAKVENL